MKSFCGTFFNCCPKTNKKPEESKKFINNTSSLKNTFQKKQLLHEDAILIIKKEESSKAKSKFECDDNPKPPYNSPVQFIQNEAEIPIFNISGSRNEEAGRSLFAIETLDAEPSDNQVLNPGTIFSFMQNSNQHQQPSPGKNEEHQNSILSGSIT